MLAVTQLRAGKTFKLDGEPFVVLKYQHTVLGRKKAHVKLKVKNLKTGRILEKTFLSGVRVEELEVEKKTLKFKYFDGTLFHFEDKEGEEFEVEKDMLGKKGWFLKKNEGVTALFWEEKLLNIKIPKIVVLKVKDTAPGVRGDSAVNLFKPAVLENGLKVRVPLFIKTKDAIRLDTETGEYAGRAQT